MKELDTEIENFQKYILELLDDEIYKKWWKNKFVLHLGSEYQTDKCTKSSLFQKRNVNEVFFKYKNVFFVDMLYKEDKFVNFKSNIDKLKNEYQKHTKTNSPEVKELKEPIEFDAEKENLINNLNNEFDGIILLSEYEKQFLEKLQDICIEK